MLKTSYNIEKHCMFSQSVFLIFLSDTVSRIESHGDSLDLITLSLTSGIASLYFFPISCTLLQNRGNVSSRLSLSLLYQSFNN